MSATLTSVAGPGQTVERRLELLEHRTLELQDSLRKLEDTLRKEVNERTQAITEERKSRELATQDLQRQVREAAVGGLRLETVGLVWLFSGLALSTWSEEAARLAGVVWLFCT